MVIDSVNIQGMADLSSLQLDGLERVSRFRGPDPGSVALGDALELFFSALSPRHLRALLRRWEVLAPDEDADIIGERFPDQASWSQPAIGGDIVADLNQRAITIAVTVRLDPVLFRALRAEAARQPRLVTALSGGPFITVTVGVLFTRSFDAMALSINSAQIGEERFPTLSSERPAWLTQLLEAMGQRFYRHGRLGIERVAHWALQAATSREHHQRYRAWQDALRAPLGEVRAVNGPGDIPALLVGDRPIRRWGYRGERVASRAAAVYLSGADVLWIDDDDPLLEAGITQGALEQVLMLSPHDGTLVEPPPEQPRAMALRSRRRS